MRTILFITALFLIMNSNAQTKVLFLGNSFTFMNDLPTLFNNFAISAGISVTIDQNTQGGMAVADEQITGHVNDPVSQSKITSQQWDYIVLQDNMGDYANTVGVISSGCGNANAALYNMIKANNSCTRIIYFAGWGPVGGASSGDNTVACIDRIHGNMIYLNNGIGQEIVTPIGKAWNTSFIQLPSVNLYYSDNVHPSLEGSYLAAATIFTSIFKINPTNLSYTGAVNSSTAQTMRTIAYNTVTNATYFTTTHLSNYTPIITQSGAFINAPTGYTSYQWYLNGNPVGTGTNSCTITSSGDYQVEVINSGGCSLTSFELNINSTNIENEFQGSCDFNLSKIAINIYEVSTTSIGTITVFDMQGKLINTLDKSSEKVNVDLSNATSGIYLISLSNRKNKFSRKVLVN